jgi:hypothetical protein
MPYQNVQHFFVHCLFSPYQPFLASAKTDWKTGQTRLLLSYGFSNFGISYQNNRY